MTTQKSDKCQFKVAYDGFINGWAKYATDSARALFAAENSDVIKAYLVKRLQAVSVALESDNVKVTDVGVLAGMYVPANAENAVENRAFDREAFNSFLDSLRNCRSSGGRATIKARNAYGSEENSRYFVEPTALNRLLTPPAAPLPGGGLDVTGRPIAPEKPSSVKLSDLYDADIYSKEFNVSCAHYARYSTILAKYERGSYKSTLRAKKLIDSQGEAWKIPAAVSNLDHVLQGVINLAIQEYLKEDSLSLFNKLFKQEAMVLAGKKRGLGSEVQRYLACILPSLQLRAVGEGDTRRYEFAKRKGYDRALFIYDVPSVLDNGKTPTTPLISLRNFFILENELKSLRRVQNAKNAERYSEDCKVYEERLTAFEAALAEQAAKQ